MWVKFEKSYLLDILKLEIALSVWLWIEITGNFQYFLDVGSNALSNTVRTL